MSKRIRISVAVLACVALLVTSIFANHQAVQRKGAVVAASNAKSAAIVATTAAVLKETSELRELPILHPVKSGAQTRAEIEQMVMRNLDEQTTPVEAHATEQFMKKLGLAPPDFQYRAFLIKLLTEQVAGYFDPKQQMFFLADWIDLEGQKPVMAHELTHALQDQHFNLRRFEKWPKGDSDAELAAHALIEGDATLAMKVYMAKNPLVAFAFLRSFGSNAMPSEQYQQARERCASHWCSCIRRAGLGDGRLQEARLEGVSAAFRAAAIDRADPPPEKYFAHEAPVKVTLPDLRSSWAQSGAH